jgi:hypothetical protein
MVVYTEANWQSLIGCYLRIQHTDQSCFLRVKQRKWKMLYRLFIFGYILPNIPANVLRRFFMVSSDSSAPAVAGSRIWATGDDVGPCGCGTMGGLFPAAPAEAAAAAAAGVAAGSGGGGCCGGACADDDGGTGGGCLFRLHRMNNSVVLLWQRFNNLVSFSSRNAWVTHGDIRV